MIANYPHILDGCYPKEFLNDTSYDEKHECIDYFFFHDCKRIPRVDNDLKEYKFFITNDLGKAKNELQTIEHKVILEDSENWATITGKCSATNQIVSPISFVLILSNNDRKYIPLAQPNKSFWDRFTKKLYIKEIDPQTTPGAVKIMERLYAKIALRNLVFYSSRSREKVLKYDFLFNLCLLLVNKKVLQILQKPGWEQEFEYFPAIIRCKDGDLIGQYYVINILKYMLVTDLDRSIFDERINSKILDKQTIQKRLQQNSPEGFRPIVLYFKENLPNNFIIVRDQVDKYLEIVSPAITQELLDNKVKGINLIVPNGNWISGQNEFIV
jgi:hypothetical protein